MASYAAIDLGATSGRVAVGTISNGKISFEIIHRFTNDPINDPENGLLWNWSKLQEEVIIGLKMAVRKYTLTSVAVDSWGVDYQLLKKDGSLNPRVFSYRNRRLDGVMENTIKLLGKERIYSATGIQFLPFNTIYQLIAGLSIDEFNGAGQFLMLPDALNYFLCGSMTQEVTNASTTQLLDPTTRDWDWELITESDLPRGIFPPLHEAGSVLGKITGHAQLDGIKVVAVGSHDTASAVAAVPMTNPEKSIYISSGTWSLVGYEKMQANTSQQAFEIDLTNELGVQGTVRSLRNVAGMWLLSECQRDWKAQGLEIEVEALVAEAQKVPANTFLINPNDHFFLAAGNMVGRISEYCLLNNSPTPSTPAEYARCIFDSLAQAYHDVILDFEAAEGHTFDVIYVVGGGSANNFLNQLTADVTRKRVITGAVEATLLGNIGMQAISAGEISGLPELREMISSSITQKVFLPS
ncbi:MAG: rhamnulokinase family protein [Actinomycetes bacterium]|jgi:rhamnulokinase